MAQQKFKIELPKDLKPQQRLELADLIIEHIYDRTNRGLDKKGRRFPGYSKEYINSLDFKIASKSKSKVDLQLSGDMLAAIKILNHSSGNLTIGFDRGTDENAKAEGNILGTYGQSSPIPGKKRDFLGIEKSKLRELLEFVKDGDKQQEVY